MKYLLLLLLFFIQLSISAHPPWGIAVDKHRNVFFPDILHHERGAVWKLDAKGRLHLLLSDFHAHNVNLDHQGNLYTAHGEGEHTMVRLSPKGDIDTLMHTADINQFSGGNCMYTPQGDILFGLHKRIWKAFSDRHPQPAIEHEFGWNQSIYCDEEGIIYAPDIGSNYGMLIRIDTHGKSEVLAKHLLKHGDNEPDHSKDVLLGITKGCDGLLYIAETAGKRIVRIKGKDQTETFYQSTNGWFPSGIDFFAGDAYILEFKHSKTGMKGPQIIKIDESGKRSVLFNFEKYHHDQLQPTDIPHQKWNLWPVVLILMVGVVGFLILWLRRITASFQ